MRRRRRRCNAPDGTWKVRAYGGMFFEKMQKEAAGQAAPAPRAATVTVAGGRVYTVARCGVAGLGCVPMQSTI